MPSASTITINRKAVDVSAVPLEESILDFLRRTGSTGSKVGCNEGDCGACTILLLEKEGSPRAINGCLALVHSLVGREILTAEGLVAADGTPHPVQKAMVDCNGSQCGYCTPGIVCSMAESAARGTTGDPVATADQLCGNLCRCTGYRPIREAAASLDPNPIPLPSSTGPRRSGNREIPHTLHPGGCAATQVHLPCRAVYRRSHGDRRPDQQAPPAPGTFRVSRARRRAALF